MAHPAFVSATSSTDPSTHAFPHICPHEPEGASLSMCRKHTSEPRTNLHGCCGTLRFRPCDSPGRLCIMCVTQRNPNSQRVADVKTGLCASHASMVAQSLQRRRERAGDSDDDEESLLPQPLQGEKPEWKLAADDFIASRASGISVKRWREISRVYGEMRAANHSQLRIGKRFGYQKGGSAQTWATSVGKLAIFAPAVWDLLIERVPHATFQYLRSLAVTLEKTEPELRMQKAQETVR